MIRFFRRYRKIIILVGLPILLVIFLIPTSIQTIGDYSARRGKTIATLVTFRGESEQISSRVYDERQRELEALTKALPGFPFTLLSVLGIGEVEKAEHWLLLVHEAEEHGLIGGIDDANSVAVEIAQWLTRMSGEDPVPADQLILSMASNSRMSVADVRQALVHARAVSRLFNLYAGASKISDKRIVAAADRVLQGVDARVVLLQGKADAEGLSDPADESLLAQFEQFKSVNPGEGERGFGYMLPDRLQLEWMEVSPRNVREGLERSGKLERLELRKYWVQNKEQFKAPGAAADHQATFEEVEPQVREAFLAAETSKTLTEITRYCESEIARRLRELSRRDMFYDLPDDWEQRRLPLHELASQIGAQFSVGTPEYQKRGDVWYSAEELAALPGIGLATTVRFGDPMRLADMAPHLKEFGGTGEVPVQAGVEGPTLTLDDGTLFFYRVIATDKARAPLSLDEVRDKVVADLKRAADYERLAARAEELRSEALAVGLDSFARARDSVAIPSRNIGFSPDDSSLVQRYRRNATQFMPPVGRDEEAINPIVARGRELLTRLLSEHKTIEDVPLADLTFVVPVPKKLSLLVVQITDLRPAVREDLATLSPELQQIIVREELGGGGIDVFTYDRIAERFKFVMERGEDADEADPAETQAAATGG